MSVWSFACCWARSCCSSLRSCVLRPDCGFLRSSPWWGPCDWRRSVPCHCCCCDCRWFCSMVLPPACLLDVEAALARFPVLDLLLGLVLADAVGVLDLADQLVALAG